MAALFAHGRGHIRLRTVEAPEVNTTPSLLGWVFVEG